MDCSSQEISTVEPFVKRRLHTFACCDQATTLTKHGLLPKFSTCNFLESGTVSMTKLVTGMPFFVRLSGGFLTSLPAISTLFTFSSCVVSRSTGGRPCCLSLYSKLSLVM